MSDPRYPGGPPQQHAGYRPHQPELDETTQLPVFSYQQDQPVEAPPPEGMFSGSPALVWTLRALGLIAVAVISGLVWYYITNDGTPQRSGQPGQQAKSGKYAFVVAPQLPEPVRDSNCVEHSSKGQVQDYLKAHQCRGLVRELYTVKAADGRTVYASVSAIQMASAADASGLQKLTSKDGTGNVKDLVLDGEVQVPGLTELDKHGGYASQQIDAKLIIVEADFSTGASSKDQPQLDAMCEDALRFGAGLN